MTQTKRVLKRLLPCAIVMMSLLIHAQGLTIPEQVATGALGGVASVPSGPVPSVADLLRTADLVVVGTLGEGRGYLSQDQREVYTDFPLANATILYQAQAQTTKAPGEMPQVTVTQLGGTVTVSYSPSFHPGRSNRVHDCRARTANQ